ncbi:hypothetical protein [Gordoniibacillus kamchatkensis]|uniref:hypothetical protein n=1 Tax=Gordoniibacillus kamchatkensis TaxID=1590651 RepID=UPI0006979691|nr:hypothetical protein [Paenibacillus sp. VKM B-2647]
MGVFFIAGFVVYALFFLLRTWRLKDGWFAWAKFFGVILVYLAAQQAINASFIQSGITDYPLSSREPYWKYMVGLNRQTTGGWSYDDDQYVLKYPLGEPRNEAERQLMLDRMSDKQALLQLFADKFKFMWGTADSSVMWSLWELKKPWLDGSLTATERIGYVAMAFFALTAMIGLLRRPGGTGFTLFLILLLGYAAVHIVIEVQTRYRFDIMPCLIVLQSFGIYSLLSWRTAASKQDVQLGQ